MKKYKTIVVDPPWEVKRGPEYNSNGKSRKLTYPTMTLKEIEDLSLKELADKDCVLYLWTINKYIEQSYALARKWGFKPSTMLVWVKNPNGIGLGGTYSLSSEFCLYAVKGMANSKKRHPTNWWLWQRGRHSQKPDEFMDMVEHTSNPPYLEVFARPWTPLFQERTGWDVWGNEVESDIDLVSLN